jgi:hypothetical protein
MAWAWAVMNCFHVPELPGDRWPAGPAVRVRPVAGDQLPVPAQERGRG